MKNILEGNNIQLNETEDEISNLEVKIVENTQSEFKKAKELKK